MTRGYWRENVAKTFVSNPDANASGHPTRISPAVGSARSSISLAPRFSSSNASLPRLSSARPQAVVSTPWGVRSSRRTPIECSMLAMAFDTEGCERASRLAALPMLPISATVMKMCRSCNLMGRPIRSVHFITNSVLRNSHSRHMQSWRAPQPWSRKPAAKCVTRLIWGPGRRITSPAILCDFCLAPKQFEIALLAHAIRFPTCVRSCRPNLLGDRATPYLLKFEGMVLGHQPEHLSTAQRTR